MSELELTIDHSEWEAVSRKVVPFCGDDERDRLGMVMVTSNGANRRWWASDSFRMARLEAGADSDNYTLLISPRLLEAWPLAAGDTDTATLRVERTDGDLLVTLRGPGGTFSSPLLPAEAAPLPELATGFDTDPGASVTLEAQNLHRMITLATSAPSGPFLEDDRPSPPFRLSVTESGLLATVDWAELGEQSHEAPGVSSGVGSAVISPRFMLNAVQVLDPGDVTVTIPDDEERAIRISQSELSVYIMPRSESDMTRSAVEEVLEECFGPDVLRPDADGDYGLSIYGVPVYARLIEGQPSSLKVFAQVVTEIESSAELLEELNALNAAYDFVKVVLHGAVLAVEGDLVADTLDAPELTTLYDRIRYVANELGPALTAMYGGIGVERGDTTRWSTYTRTAVLTELRPGQIVDLSGPNAVEEWPFPGEIHVITAWNPFGRFRTVEQNDEQNALLAADIVRAGGTALRAEGRSLDVDYGEPSLLVWGLDTATVIEIAAAYDQEAVFRIDADQLKVLGVFQEQRAARPRLTARSDASHDDSNG